MPPRCAEARSAPSVRMAAGEAMAAVVGARLASIDTSRDSTMMTGGWKTTAAMLCPSRRSRAWPPASAPAGGQERREPVVERRSHSRHCSRTTKAETLVTAKSSQKHTIKGMVLGPDGKPLPARRSSGSGYPRFQRSRMARPKGFKERPEEQAKIAGHEHDRRHGPVRADGGIRRRGLSWDAQVIVKAPGAGSPGETSSVRPSKRVTAKTRG